MGAQGKTSSASLSPNSMLETAVVKDLNCATFEEFKEKLREFWSKNLYRNDLAKEWKSFSDIPAKEARILLKVVKT